MRFWIGLLTLWASLGLAALIFMSTAFLSGKYNDHETVVLYAAQDQVYAEPGFAGPSIRNSTFSFSPDFSCLKSDSIAGRLDS